MKKNVLVVVVIALLSLCAAPSMATTFIAQYASPTASSTPAPGVPRAASAVPPGLYVQVLDGTINVANGGGTQQFTAGQFGFTPGFQAVPVIVPKNPGLQFTPPPTFSSTAGSSSSSAAAKAGGVDCEVR